MTQADKWAMEAYPPKMEFVGNTHLEVDLNEMNRLVYAEGFQMAKKIILDDLQDLKRPFQKMASDVLFDKGHPDAECEAVVRGIIRAMLIVQEV